MKLSKTVGTVTAAAALIMALPGFASADDAFVLPPERGYVDVTPVDGGVSVTLTAPSYHACNAMVVFKTTRDAFNAAPGVVLASPPAWSDPYALLAHDPDLIDTPRFGDFFLDYASPRSTVMNLDAGTYVIAGQCVPYDQNGDFAGDDIEFAHEFTVGGIAGPQDPDNSEDPPSRGVFGSIEQFFGS